MVSVSTLKMSLFRISSKKWQQRK